MPKRLNRTAPLPAEELKALMDAARAAPPMTPAQIREQRISFAYGNSGFENTAISKELVAALHDEIYGNPDGAKITQDEDVP